MASDPLPPVLGVPGLEPGSADSTTPELSLLLLFPAGLLGGARAAPISPMPTPFLPEAERPEPESAEGGGGITLLARRVPLPEPAEFLAPEVDPVLTDGGGGTMFWLDAPRDEPGYFLDVDPAPADAFVPETEGGGGMTLDAACDLSPEDLSA
jgi:hypothetical protein